MQPGNDNYSGTGSAKSSTPAAPTALRAEEWRPLLNLAAEEVFEIMLGRAAATALVPDPQPDENFTAMVGLTGSLRGVVTLFCGMLSAHQIAAGMLGTHETCTEEQVCDALGETCNMIAGNFKNKISGMSAKCMLSTPSVIIGTDYKLYSVAASPALVIRLLFEDMPIVISLHFHN